MSCPICDGEQFEDALIAYDRVVARAGEFRYSRCSTCRVLSQTPLPAGADLPGLYPADYRSHASSVAADGSDSRRRDVRPWNRLALGMLRADRAPPRRAVGRHARAVLGRVAASELAVPRGGNRLLDVGCGSGRLLARHRALGWEVQGIEPNARAVAACHAAGLPVERAELLDASLPEGHFDVVMLKHVIEHVPDPVAALARAGSLLAPGGLLIVVTPNTDGIGFRLYDSCWYALDAPRHLHLFDRQNLRRLAERAGLRVESISVQGTTRVLSRSRCYARHQGRELPDDLDARRASIAGVDQAGPDAAFRRLASPVVAVLAWLGLGDTLRGCFTRGEP